MLKLKTFQSHTRVIAAALLGFCGFLSLIHPTSAGASQITGSAHLEDSHIPAIARSLQSIRSTNPAQNISISFVLKPRNADEMNDLLRRVSDPHDTLYGHYLTPEEFRDKFGATQAQIDAVSAFAAKHGLTVDEVSPNNLFIKASAPVSAINAAFGITLRDYVATDGHPFHSPNVEPSVDVSIKPLLKGVIGLSTAPELHDFLHPTTVPVPVDSVAPSALYTPGAPGPDTTHEPTNGFAPTDVQSIYSTTTLLKTQKITGTGQIFGLFELGTYYPADITKWQSTYSQPTPYPTLSSISVDGYNTSSKPGSAFEEVTLDIDMLETLAPNASQIRIYEGTDTSTTFQTFIDIFAAIANETAANRPTVISCSYGYAEDTLTAAEVDSEALTLAQLAIQGQTVCVASGDAAAYADGGSTASKPNVSDPEEQPTVVSCGGTDLTDSSTTPYTLVSETSWYDKSDTGRGPLGTGGGGGISANFAIPYYQVGSFSTTVNTQGSTTHRNVPDVSLYGDYDTGGYAIVYTSGSKQLVGGFNGTSAASPLWAALLGDVNDIRQANGTPNLGLANPSIYTLAESSSYATDFYDVNDSSTNGFYKAVTGYDNSTGWGTARNGTSLVNDLANEAFNDYTWGFALSPTTVTAGASSTVTLTLDFAASSANTFAVTSSNPSVAAVPSSATIAAKGTSTTFNITTSAVSAATNVTITVTAFGVSRNAVLTVNPSSTPAPTLTSISPTTAASAGSSFTLTANGTNFVAASTIDWNGSALPTTYVSSTKLTATVDSSLIATEGTAEVTVYTPAPGGGTSSQIAFTITDGVPPTTTATLSPSAPNGSNSWYTVPVQVTLSATDDTKGSGVANTYYTVDSGSKQTYSAPFTVSGDGNHTVTYYSVDKSGNTETTKTVSFKIDGTAPVTTASTSGNSPTTVTLSASDATSGVATTYYTIDSGSQQTYSSSFTVSGGGSHTVKYYSVDVAGNTETTKTLTFSIDTTPPVTTVTLSPSSPNGTNGWYTVPVQVTLSATDTGSGVATTYYTIDSGSQQTYSAPFTLSSDGSHTITYYSVDKMGNSESPKTLTIKIDATAPVTTASSSGNNPTTVTLSASDATSGVATTYYTIDSGSQQTYSGSFTVSGGGSHTVSYYSVDVAGNTESSHTLSLSIDTTPPVTTATLSPSSPNGSNGWYTVPVQVTLAATDSGSGVATTYYTVDGGSQQTYSGAFTVSGDASHTVTYYSVDNDGNSESPNTLTIKIDSTAPVTTASTSGSNPTTVTLNASDALSGVATTYYTIDSGSQQTYTGPFAVSGNGSHTVSYYSVDVAGNTETAHTLSLSIDSTPPVTTATLNPSAPNGNNGYYKTPVQITLSATDSGSGVAATYYTVDGGAQQTYSAPFTVSGDGTHSITYYSVDNAGNAETPNPLSIEIDGTAPTLAFGAASPAANSAGWNNSTVTIPYTDGDATSGVQSATPGSPLSFSSEGKGQTQLVTVTDVAGNSASFTSPAVNIDETAPVSTASRKGTGPITVTIKATDNLSGVAATYYTINGGAQTTYTAPFSVSTPGKYAIKYYSVDVAGNTETAKSISFTIAGATLAISSLSLNPTTVKGGATTSTATVTLNGPAPSNGALVHITSSNTSVATVVGNVKVAAGATSATFLVHALPVSSSTNVTITVTYTTSTAQAVLTVTNKQGT